MGSSPLIRTNYFSLLALFFLTNLTIKTVYQKVSLYLMSNCVILLASRSSLNAEIIVMYTVHYTDIILMITKLEWWQNRFLSSGLVTNFICGFHSLQKNGTAKDIVTVFTGAGDITKYGLIDRFNGENKLKHWTTQQCNQLNGSDGSIFPPHISKNDTIYVYDKDICRLLPLTWVTADTPQDIAVITTLCAAWFSWR